MELKIGEVIMAKRRERAWTQEQLAGAVGVSAPAVSKWETGATYPDITLLSPIARALNTTVDELLSYQSELSSEEVGGLARKAARIYESEGFEAGWSHCQGLLREYPNSVPLKFQLGNLFQSFLLMKPGIEKQEIQGYYRQAAGIYEEVLASGYPKLAYPATIILVGCYVMLGELDRAEELLDGLPKLSADPEVLYSSLLALRGKKDEALKLAQESIRRYVSRASMGLSLLCSFAREREELDAALALAELNLALTRLFDLREELAYPDMIKVLAARGDKEGALGQLEDYANSVATLSYDHSESPVFNRLEKEPGDASYIKKILAQSILIDKEYASLQDEPRYLRIAEELRLLAGANTSTFDERAEA